MPEIFTTFSNAVKNGKLVALATILAGPSVGNKMLFWPTGETIGSLGSAQLDQLVQEQATELLKAQRSARLTLKPGAEPVDVFIEIQAPPPKLLIIGAVHIAIPLVTFGKALGFQTIVLDARSAFATPERFAHADQLRVGWPADLLADIGIDENTFVVVLTHDEKIDNPTLDVALRSSARYIGALGSQKTHARRVAALKEVGITDEQLARLHTPIGLEIGARRPEEIAVAIIGEIVAVSHGLREQNGKESR